MKRVILSVAGACVVASLSGCAPRDPKANLKWHIDKVIRANKSGKAVVCQAKDETEAYHIMSRADRESYGKPFWAVRARLRELADSGTKWYRTKFVLDDQYECAVTKSDLPTTPYTAEVTVTYKESFTKLCKTKEEAERATLSDWSDGGCRLAYVYENNQWTLKPSPILADACAVGDLFEFNKKK
jgi:hypothetical protein